MVIYLHLVNVCDRDDSMKLYYSPGACSLADHIALIETGLPYALVAVDLQKRTDDGRDFRSINPKGYVPALEFDDGSVLTENVAILAWIADQGGSLLPKTGLKRWRALEAAVFMATEIHRGLRPFFLRDAIGAEKARSQLVRNFEMLGDQLADAPFLLGDEMTIADPYLFWAVRWAIKFGIDLPEGLHAHQARLKTRPSVARALAEEGID